MGKTKREKTFDRLAELLKDVDPERVIALIKPAKEERIEIRVTTADKESMRAAAAELEISLAEYLTGLHLVAQEQLSRRKSSKPKKKK